MPARRTSPRQEARAELERFQSALAALLMEPSAMQDYDASPRRYGRRRGLTEPYAKLLASADPAGLRYFASRRRIDRFSYLQSDLPRSVAALEATVGTGAYFDSVPYAKDRPHLEARQLEHWASCHPRVPGWARDVIRIESAALLLLHQPFRPPRATRCPRLAPGVQLLELEHDPDALLGPDPAHALAADRVAALQRTESDVEVYALEPHAVAILEAASGRLEDRKLIMRLAGQHSRRLLHKALKDLRRIGLITPPKA